MIISIFLIVLIAAFAALVFFTEPSKSDKLINARLASLDKPVSSAGEEDAGIVREVTFSKIAWVDRYLKRNALALGLQLLIVQADLTWTVGRFVFTTFVAVIIGAALGNLFIGPGLVG